MSALGKMFLLCALAIGVTGMAVEQPPFQPGGFFGKGKGGDYFTLLQNGQIKDELKLTNQQVDKLPAAAMKALAEVLDPQQVKRLREIYLQQRGNTVFLEADVAKDLKITDDQSKKIRAAMDSQTKEMQDMMQSGNFDFEKLQEIQKNTNDAVHDTLTKDQKAAWTKMIGQPFEMKGPFGKKK